MAGTVSATAGAGGASATGTSGSGGTSPNLTGGSGGAITPTAGTGGGKPAASAGAGGTTPSGGSGPAGGAPVGTGGAPVAGGGAGGETGPVTVQLGQAKQTMAGFGINNNWAPALAASEADELFNTTGKGIGLSILRIGMGSDGNPFNGDDAWADIDKAKSRGVTTFIGTLWSPPANCKTNNSENDGGHLKSECYESWSNTIAAFPAKVKQATGVDLYAMSPQNEPDFASCGDVEPCNGNYPTTLFTAEEMVAFIKVVGPKLQALTPKVNVLAPEASEWLHNWSDKSATGSEPGNKNSSDPLKCGFMETSACAPGKGYDYGHALYADKAAWAALDIMGVHQYDTQVAFPWPADVPEKKPVWQTEMSGVKWWPEQGPSATIENGIAVAGWIHSAVVDGEAAAWFWWWYKAYNTDDNEGLYLKNGQDTKRHYTLGNYSKFVRPGYVRVHVSGAAPANVLLSAYKGPDGTVVIVAINKGGAVASVPITIGGGTAPASLTPWVTSSADNLASKTAVTVTGGAFTAELGSKTVTTFVGK